MGTKKSKNIIQETNQVDELEKEYNEYKNEKDVELIHDFLKVLYLLLIKKKNTLELKCLMLNIIR